MMTVRELIDILSASPDDLPVYLAGEDWVELNPVVFIGSVNLTTAVVIGTGWDDEREVT